VIALAASSSSSSSVFDQPGTLGFLVVFGLAVIMYFVFRSMTKHLRKVNEAARAEAAKAEAEARPQTRSAGNAAPPGR
jgi:hypothetical protein